MTFPLATSRLFKMFPALQCKVNSKIAVSLIVAINDIANVSAEDSLFQCLTCTIIGYGANNVLNDSKRDQTKGTWSW